MYVCVFVVFLCSSKYYNYESLLVSCSCLKLLLFYIYELITKLKIYVDTVTGEKRNKNQLFSLLDRWGGLLKSMFCDYANVMINERNLNRMPWPRVPLIRKNSFLRPCYRKYSCQINKKCKQYIHIIILRVNEIWDE